MKHNARILFTLIVILLSINGLYTEEIEDIINNPLNTPASSDTVNSPETTEISMTVEQFKEQIDLYITYYKEKEDLPLLNENLIYTENFHWQAFSDPQIYIKDGSFLIHPFRTENYSIVQNFYPIMNINQSINRIDLNVGNYNLKPSLTSSDLALGDNNMNHAAVKFEKGSIIAIPGLNMDFSYLGQEGNWLGNEEHGYSFCSHLWYQLNNQALHFNILRTDQNISSRKRIYPSISELESIKEDYFAPSLFWENPYLNLGLRYESWELDDKKRTQNQIVARKAFGTRKLSADISFEYSQKEENNVSNDDITVSYDVNYSPSNLDVMANGYMNDNDDFWMDIEAKYLINNKIGPLFTLTKIDDQTKSDILAFGIIYEHQKNKISLLYGSDDKSNQDFFLESNLKLSIPINIFLLNFKNWLKYYPEDYDEVDVHYIPKLQTKWQLELAALLPYNNKIKLGVNHCYHSDIDYLSESSSFEYNSSIFDLYLAIGITPKFEIRGEIKNLSNSSYLFKNQDILLTGTHFNARVTWFFLN